MKVLPKLRRFRDDRSGSATIEAVLWLPVFFGLVALTADTAMVFNGQARMQRIVQDANRMYSVGQYTTTDQVVNAISSAVSNITSSPTITTTLTPAVTPKTITTVLSIPASKFEMLGWFTGLNLATVTVKSEQYIEY